MRQASIRDLRVEEVEEIEAGMMLQLRESGRRISSSRLVQVTEFGQSIQMGKPFVGDLGVA